MKRSALVLGLLLASCGQVYEGAAVGGETHFLVTCEEGCGAELSCIEGVCTRRCEPGLSTCLELDSAAYCKELVAPAAMTDRAPDWSSGVPYRGVCEVECSDTAGCAALGSGYSCIDDRCRAEPDARRSELASQVQPLVRAVEPSTCDTGLRWVGGDRPSAEMHPGSDCLGCHGPSSAAPFLAAGTVYPRGAFRSGPRSFGVPEPAEGCFGIEGVEVVITDGAGRQRSTFSNRAGNFYFEGDASDFVLPYTANLRFDLNGTLAQPEMFLTSFYGGCARCHSDREVFARGGATMPPFEFLDQAELVRPAGSVIFTPGLFSSE